ncbi:hypothetical protein BRADI_3g58393v3 [Brachypodium distachyon]|uniref:Uncharacterized protein n=1 Tax=Brachypodium distachyon TaxID=15368 RepID=A0A0Q3QJM4_BRADI|nr:hypothetical protein BRADI_3g58393v3 [Brachypodium distachyon]
MEVNNASALAACASLGRLDVGIKLHELARSKEFIRYVVANALLLLCFSPCGDTWLCICILLCSGWVQSYVDASTMTTSLIINSVC